MTDRSFAARTHIRTAVLCSLLALVLAACGDAGSSGAASSPVPSLVTPKVGLINRTAVVATAPAANPVTSAGKVSPQPVSGPPPKAVSTGTATLDWTPPTENSDGSALTNLAGYNVYYGTAPDKLTQTVKVANPGLSAYTLSSLSPGTWYFAVSSYSSAGVESSRSSVVSTKI